MFSIFRYCMSFCIKLWSIYTPYESGRISYYFIQCFQYFAIAWMCGGSSHDYVYHNALAYEHMLLLFPRENLLSSASGSVWECLSYTFVTDVSAPGVLWMQVPSTLGPIIVVSWMRKELAELWEGTTTPTHAEKTHLTEAWASACISAPHNFCKAEQKM